MRSAPGGKEPADSSPSSFLTLALGLWLGLRVFYTTLGVLATPWLDLDPVRIRSNWFTDSLLTREDGWIYGLLGVWERFDTLWYLHIAEHGYDTPQASVFYPLYPLLIRVVSPLTGSPLAAALVVSSVAAFFLLLGLPRLLRLDLSAPVAARSLLVLATWPSSFTLFAAYPDSLVIAFVVWSLYWARTGKWFLAGAAGLAAGLTKTVGLCVVVPLAVLAWRERSWRGLAAGLVLAAPILFTLVLGLSGQPLQGRVYPQYWRTVGDLPWRTVGAALHEAVTNGEALLWMNLGVLLLTGLCALLWRDRWEYAMYSLAALTLFLCKHTDPILQSTMRYTLAVFPAYAGLARALPPRVLVFLSVVVLFPLNLLLLWAFFNWSLVV